MTAAGTTGLGGRVALIDRKKMGGDCLNYGCVPSKALISAGRVIDQMRRAEEWGLEAAGVAHHKGGIRVNDYLQTSQSHIYACGDIVGPYQFTHLADRPG